MSKIRFFSYLVFSAFIALFFLGCGSKFYYKPSKEEIKAQIGYTAPIPAPIVHLNREGATLQNGRFITREGDVPNFTLPVGGRYLNHSDKYYLVGRENPRYSDAPLAGNENVVEILIGNQAGAISQTNPSDVLVGEMLVIDKQSNEIHLIRTNSIPIAATMENNLLAVVLQNNTLLLYDFDAKRTLLFQESAPMVANNTLVASPKFLKDLIVFPTLDGKLVVLDKRDYKPIRNIVVNGDRFFNNVIYLEIFNDRMVAATPKRVISVSPSVINTFDANIKDLLYVDNNIYLFTSEGEIILTDYNLNTLSHLKLPFAHFSGVTTNGRKIFSLETMGYLLEIDPDLKGYEVMALIEKVTQHVYAVPNRIFVGLRYIDVTNR